MGNELSREDRRRWHKLYVAGWRTIKNHDLGKWYVIDHQGRIRSQGHTERWVAVAEVVAS